MMLQFKLEWLVLWNKNRYLPRTQTWGAQQVWSFKCSLRPFEPTVTETFNHILLTFSRHLESAWEENVMIG